MNRLVWIVVAAVVTVLALGAGAVALDLGRGDDGRPMTARGTGGGVPGGMQGMHGVRGMHGVHAMRGVRVDSERAWLTEMVAHHEEAVDAAAELGRSDREEMRELGASIVADQSAQIDLMEGWLDDWYGGPAENVEYEPMMRDLTRLSGDRLDRVFLQDMTRHHMMAVMMSQQLLVRGLAEHADAADLARDIRDAQHRELFEMQQWLADWFGRSIP